VRGIAGASEDEGGAQAERFEEAGDEHRAVETVGDLRRERLAGKTKPLTRPVGVSIENQRRVHVAEAERAERVKHGLDLRF
jgi:hypothetical protein